MSKYLNSFVGYSEGAVNVLMYDWDKSFLPGDKVRIRINSQMKLTRVSYCWDNGEKTGVKVFFNHCWFKPRVPNAKVDGNCPVLKIITEVQFSDGTETYKEHTFEINNMKWFHSSGYICIRLNEFLGQKLNWHHHGAKELAHLEMVGTIVHQLTEGASIEEIEKAGLSAYYTDHGVYL